MNRFLDPSGYCRTGAGFSVSSICIHQGEEPVIGGKQGICNVFFSGCNLRCIYCQNHEISFVGKSGFSGPSGTTWPAGPPRPENISLHALISRIISILDQGIQAVGFVSPSHVVPQVRMIISELHRQGRKPVFVYNTNAYEKTETIRNLEGMIDVFLPDFKYMDEALAMKLSDAPHYPETALSCIQEMYRQKGSVLITDNEGQAQSGLIIRHLILPGHLDNSISVLHAIAKEISTGVSVSLMSQYYPTVHVQGMEHLERCLYPEEYRQVVSEFESLGFRKGYIQKMDSAQHYQPDFSKDHPFE